MSPTDKLKPRPYDREFCVLCNEKKPLTGEHIFAAWIGKAIGYDSRKSSDIFGLDQDLTYTPINEEHSQRKLRILCGDCNNHWGSDLQTATSKFLKPLLLGETFTLDNNECEILTRWVTCFVMVREFGHPTLVSITSQARKTFRDVFTIPEGTRIWIGRFDGVERNLTSWHRSLAWNMAAVAPEHPDTFFMLFAIAKVVIFVFGSSSPQLKYSDDLHIFELRKYVE